MLRLLHLTNVTQRSFAEYHSKRNFEERVHAGENLALSRHGLFSTTKIHQHADKHSEKHLENMNAMADAVISCLSKAKFGGLYLQCFRGVANNGIFTDEKLKEFLSLSEEMNQLSHSFNPECVWL